VNLSFYESELLQSFGSMEECKVKSPHRRRLIGDFFMFLREAQPTPRSAASLIPMQNLRQIFAGPKNAAHSLIRAVKMLSKLRFATAGMLYKMTYCIFGKNFTKNRKILDLHNILCNILLEDRNGYEFGN
jgi:hypothetical protein